ncbi:energy transducer TonB [Sediminibacterium ginsengisoli]|uniref:Outer membrane transport energization protein TonB n=1 Tax=Sediminibacterium ginsengisoli TaxID=413434 RepID=A0A1T4K1D1_9BACT|nr:energy transducer TonB [Sediminibacterium ginsengisoli]SJZ36286.1 outer membrane transport energization protein TonB [Sediminibacterium ginsengisoli]
MEKQKILSADILDILFEGKNKEYGAYELRKTYEKRITYALSGTAVICLLLFAGSILARDGKKQDPQLYVDKQIELESVKKDPPPEELPKPEQKPVEEKPIATVKNLTPQIVPDKEVTPEDEVKSIDEMVDVKIGKENLDGEKGVDIVTPPVEKSIGVGEGLKVKEPDYEKDIFYNVQIAASFNGGMDAWRKYLERNLNRDLPSENGAPPAQYTVTVSFIVDREGRISDVKAENDPGFGTKEEAVRVILKGPNWIPAQQNGHKVIYRHRQRITFQVE